MSNLGGWINMSLFRDNIIGKETEGHCIPLNDLRKHDVSSACWCKPRLIDADCYLHNALDDRESYENGRKLQ